MNKTIFIALIAMFTVLSYGQERRKSDNMPKTEICKDIVKAATGGTGISYNRYYTKTTPIEFQRNYKDFFMILKASGDRQLPVEVDLTITFDDGTVFTAKMDGVSSGYNKKKERWFYRYGYYLHGQPELTELLRNHAIVEYTFAEFKMINPEPDKMKEYFNCMVDLIIKR